MTSAEILSTEDFLKALWIEIGLRQEAFEREPKKMRPNNRMSLIIFCKGLANYHYFTIDRVETVGNSSPSKHISVIYVLERFFDGNSMVMSVP
jgi:hypothetical protein